MSERDEAIAAATRWLDGGQSHPDAWTMARYLLSAEPAREAALEEAAAIVRGTVYKERYRQWIFWPGGNRSEESEIVRFANDAADAVRALSKGREYAEPAREAALESIYDFLMGQGPLDGVWFGDRHPTEKGAFWWRTHLRRALSHPPKGREE